MLARKAYKKHASAGNLIKALIPVQKHFDVMAQLKKVLHLLSGLQMLLILKVAPYESAENAISTTDNDDYIDLSAYGAALLGEPDVVTTGRLVAIFNHNLSTQNPEELGSYLEGDMLVPASSLSARNGRNGLLTMSKRWPNAMVPYEIRGHFTQQDLSVISHAFKEYHTRTCVRFRPRSKEQDYIVIESGSSGCWSSVGRMGGRQVVNLKTPNCLRKYGTAMHELMHALGFLHEQNRYERDGFVRVHSENVKPKMLENFKKASSKDTHGFGVKYDYASVMHYSPTSFSKNGKPTLEALMKSQDSALMGQRKNFSKGDIQKINAMYKCKRLAESDLIGL